MRRLNRSKRDRGAVAVWVAILMVPLLVVAALAVDVGAMHVDRQRLQTGADAAALAVAQACAGGETCTDESADLIAQQYAAANPSFGGPTTGLATTLNAATGRVDVQTTSDRSFWFVGAEPVTLSARGAASWGAPSRATTIAWTFYACELAADLRALAVGGRGPILNLHPTTGAVQGLTSTAVGTTFQLKQDKHNEDAQCQQKFGGNVAPGAFGWLDGAGCEAESRVDGMVGSAPGGSAKGGCEAMLESLRPSDTVLVPIFDYATGTGNNVKYHVAGYLAVGLNDYHVGATGKSWLSVTIREWVDLEAAFETSPSAPDLGVSGVQLRLPVGTQP